MQEIENYIDDLEKTAKQLDLMQSAERDPLLILSYQRAAMSSLRLAEYLKELRELRNKTEPKKGKWIPIKTRPLTEEEKEEYPDCSFMYDCQMPDDEQVVLVSTKWGVSTDIYCKDVDGCYFEEYCDEDDVIAWQPMPEPYKEEEA